MSIPITFHLVGIACAFLFGYLVREVVENVKRRNKPSNVLPSQRVNVQPTSDRVIIHEAFWIKPEDVKLTSSAALPKLPTKADTILAAMPRKRAARVNVTVKKRKIASKNAIGKRVALNGAKLVF